MTPPPAPPAPAIPGCPKEPEDPVESATFVEKPHVTPVRQAWVNKKAMAPPMAAPASTISLWRRIKSVFQYVVRLKKNGILIQAVGVPLRHFLALYGLWLLLRGYAGWRTCVLSVALWVFSGLGVTAGAHRLWTHNSYVASEPMQALLMVMFSVADQGSIAGWALTHAMHHSASDTKWDPHNRQAGFWHAHFTWLYSIKRFHLSTAEYHRVMDNLGPVVFFHDRVCVFWDPAWSLLMPGLLGCLWGEGFVAFFVAGALRWAFVQHVTFFVNSVAHGEREEGDSHAFDAGARGIGPRVSLLTTILALGEGWHDYHHLFPWDYAASELDAWDQWNPTKVFIDAGTAFGQVSQRRRCSPRLQELRRAQLANLQGPQQYKVVGWPFLRTRVLLPRPGKSSVHSI